jgi:cyclopropane fatty-acyl-phospholipid synthase-like methyltransferase
MIHQEAATKFHDERFNLSLGAFEHFCSPEEQTAGQQEAIYRDLFSRVASVLPERGRFYLQTMVFGSNMIPLEEVDIRAPRESDAWYLSAAEPPVSRLVSSARARADRTER